MEKSGSQPISLRDIPIFAGLQDADLKKIQGITFEKVFKTGEYLFRQGDIGDAFYIIKSGAIEIVKTDAEGSEKILVSLEPGKFFGEMALIEGAPRSASARARADATMIIVKKSDFEMLLRLNSFVALKIMSELSARLHHDQELGGAEDLAGHRGVLVSFFSPKGGCGKTLSVVNLAEALVRRKPGCRVVVVDLDLQFGDVGALLHIPEKSGLTDLVAGEGENRNIDMQRFDAVAYRYSEGFDVVVAPLKPEDSELIHSKHIKQLLPPLREKYDFILVDSHSLFDDLTINLLDLSDHVYVPFFPVLLHVKNLGNCLRVMNNLEFEMEKIHLLISRFDLHDHDRSELFTPEMVEEAIRKTQKLDLKVRYRLSDDPALMAACMDQGKTIMAVVNKEQEKNKDRKIPRLAREFDLLADCLLNPAIESNFVEESGGKSFWFSS